VVGSDAPVIIAKIGDLVLIDGVAATLTGFVPNLPTPANGLSYDVDVLRDGLNDANVLAFGVTYISAGGAGSAVLTTMIPEPITVGWPCAAMGLILRRRRRSG
jgi:hypothetical protein